MTTPMSTMKEILGRWFDRPDWVDEVDRSTLRADLVAGLSVGVMLVPQAMAYATLAGLPPIYGLYASLVPLLAYPLFGSARQLAVGVVAIDMLIIGAGIGRVAEPGTERFVALAILLAFLVGVGQILMSVLRLGMLADLLSRPVITGFTAAAALVIAAGQVGPLLGMDLPRSEFVYEILGAMTAASASVHLPTALLGGGSVVLLLLLRSFAPRVPGALVVVVLGIGLTAWLGLAGQGVAVTGEVPGGLPYPAFPELSMSDVGALFPTVVTLVLIQLMSAISIGRSLSARHRYTVRPNRELMGLGSANVFGSLFQAIPVSASFSRSAINDDAGARTPMANIAAALLVALTLLFLTPLFRELPQTSLAAIIVVSALGLIDPSDFTKLVKTHRRDGAVALLTAASTLAFGIQEGVITGVVASTLTVLYRFSRPNISELGLFPGTQFFRDLDRFEDTERIPGILVLRIDAAFSFFNAAFFRDRILTRADEETEEPIRAVVVEARGINDLDTTALDALQELVGTLDRRGITFYLAGLKGRVRDVLQRSDIGEFLDDDCFHLSSHHAVRHILKEWDREEDLDRLEEYDEQAGGDGEDAPDSEVPLT